MGERPSIIHLLGYSNELSVIDFFLTNKEHPYDFKYISKNVGIEKQALLIILNKMVNFEVLNKKSKKLSNAYTLNLKNNIVKNLANIDREVIKNISRREHLK